MTSPKDLTMATFSQMLVKTGFAWTLVICILLFIIWYTWITSNLIWRWRNARKKVEKAVVNTNPHNDSSNDNYVQIATDVQDALEDDYDLYTKSIQDSFKGYKAYNEKMTSFYNNVKKTDPPDLMTPAILLPQNDNW